MKQHIPFAIAFLIVALCFSPSLLSAQFAKPIDVVLHCKDGSIYRGRIISETEDYFKIEILKNREINISKDLVDKVERDTEFLFFNKGKKHKIEGFFVGGHTGVNIRHPFTDNYSWQLQALFGYHFYNRFSVALSVDLAVNETVIAGVWITKGYFSPSLYGRYYLADSKIRPFVYSQVGCGFELDVLERDPQYGFTMQNGIGLHFASRKRTKFLLSAGHYLQRMKGSERFSDSFNNEVKIDYNYWLNLPVVKIGLEFSY